MRGRWISARPPAVKPSSRGFNGSAPSAARNGSAIAARRRSVSPAKSTRIAPDRLRSRICRASAGSAARFAASCFGLFHLASGGCGRHVHVDRDQSRGRLDSGPQPAGQAHIRARERLDGRVDVVVPCGAQFNTIAQGRSQASGDGGIVHDHRSKMECREGVRPGLGRVAAGRGCLCLAPAPTAASRGPLPPWAARTTRNRQDVAHRRGLLRQRYQAGTHRRPRLPRTRRPFPEPPSSPGRDGRRQTPSGCPRPPDRIIQQHTIHHRGDPNLSRGCTQHTGSRDQPALPAEQLRRLEQG